MSKTFRSNYSKVKLPKSQHEVEEFGRGKRGLLICEKCSNFYYLKAWHHSADAYIEKRENKDVPVGFTLCPACTMVKNKQYEGRVLIKNIPEKLRSELIGLIEGFCKRAYDRDPMDRLIAIKKEDGDLSVTVTENELANKLAQKIRSTFNGVKTKTSFNKAPGDVALAIVEFSGK
ncbi:MAG: hypothetical protein HZB99_04135 [Candidatus Harrisonbacteria bacterium]|nr:hypothetical protein [Candidatus Harrisonbacteria bacterium]